MHDDAFYVPKEMFEEWAKRDPLERFRTWLREQRRVHGRRGGRDPRRRQEAPERRDQARRGEPAAGPRRRCSRACSRLPRTSTRPTTSKWLTSGREDLPAGDLGRPPPGDAARQARLRDRRGRRRLRRRLQGDAGLPGGVRPVARDRRAARRDRDRRRLHGRRDHGHAPGRRDAVRRFRLVRLGPPRDGGRQAALPRRNACADRRSLPLRRRLLRRAVPLPEPRVELRAHPRPEGRLPVDPRGRQGPHRHRDRGPEPGSLLRAQASLSPHQGRRARTSATRSRSARRASTARATTSPS